MVNDAGRNGIEVDVCHLVSAHHHCYILLIEGVDHRLSLKNLALSYLGQNDATRDDITVDEVMKAVSTLTPTTGKKLLQGVNVKDITDPNRVTDSEINDFISTISHDVSILNKRKEDKTCYFERDGLRYYYILLEDMPLQEH